MIGGSSTGSSLRYFYIIFLNNAKHFEYAEYLERMLRLCLKIPIHSKEHMSPGVIRGVDLMHLCMGLVNVIHNLLQLLYVN